MTSLRLRSGQTRRDLELFKPVLRAYGLAYLSVVTPKLFGIIRLLRRADKTTTEKTRGLCRVLATPLHFNRFPAFCALIIGGSSALTPVFRSVFIRYFPILGAFSPDLWVQQLRVLSRFVATLIASWFSFQLLHTGHRTVVAQSKPSRTKKGDQDNADSTLGPSIDTREYDPTRFTGKTLDLTLFAAVRAADVVVGILWGKWRQYRTARNQWSWLDDKVARLTDAGVFATSAGIVMWAWFYLPERLPRAYNMWIGEAAQVDNRLVEALRRARRGTFIYGKETGQAPLLESMCRDYGWPIEWGDPARTIPIPCEMVHMGVGPSCELHALSRFFRAFRFAMLTYLPLQLAMRIRSRSFSDIVKAFSNAIRSSTFLGAFISLFYYSVCLSRTRLGPRLFDRKTVSPLMWDSGLCVAAGCIMCGWSILLENAHKRQEIAFFVATRALATVLPRRYEKKHLWRENLAFATSTAVVLTCVKENPDRVRGVLGKVLGRVLNGKT